MAVVALAVLGMGVMAVSRVARVSPAEPASLEPPSAVTPVDPASAPAPPAVHPLEPPAAESETPKPTPVPRAPAGAGLVGEPTGDSRTTIENLTRVELRNGVVSAEQAAAWKQNLQQLVQLGASAIPAIQEFLRKNRDIDFGIGGWDAVGYPSLRTGLFDALRQIGGAAAMDVSLEALQSAVVPREVAVLAKSIEAQEPERHRAAILEAARESLAMAARGQLDGRDVGPVFEVLEKYGGVDATGDLERAARQWNHYASAALGQLPEGAGIPTLVKMLDESASNIPALQALASLSTRNADAREALLAQVRSNRIGPNIWPYLSEALTGDETQVVDSVFDRVYSRSNGTDIRTTHIQFGNQNFWRMPTIENLTPDQLNRQVDLVDEFIQTASANAAAVQSLQRTRELLTRRLSQVNGSGAP